MRRYICMAFLSLISIIYVSAQGPSIVGKWTMTGKQTAQEKQYAVMEFDDQGGVTVFLHIITSGNGVNFKFVGKVNGHYERSVKAISQEFNLNDITIDYNVDVPGLTETQKNQLMQQIKPTLDGTMIPQIKQTFRTMLAQGNFKQIVYLSDETLVIGRPGQVIETFHKGGIEDIKL